MLDFFRALLDIVLPRKERMVRVDSYELAHLLISPVEHDACCGRITTLMSYRTQAVEDLIRALKYDQPAHAATLLAEALAEYLREEIAQIKLFSSLPVVLIPVPLHASRLHERGFNQIERVLEKLPEEFRSGAVSHIVTDALVRTRDTAPQTKLSRAQRLSNVVDAFSLATPEAVRNTNVILIDDVTTTGATLVEAARPLQIMGVVSLLALTHA